MAFRIIDMDLLDVRLESNMQNLFVPCTDAQGTQSGDVYLSRLWIRGERFLVSEP